MGRLSFEHSGKGLAKQGPAATHGHAKQSESKQGAAVDARREGQGSVVLVKVKEEAVLGVRDDSWSATAGKYGLTAGRHGYAKAGGAIHEKGSVQGLDHTSHWVGLEHKEAATVTKRVAI